MTVALYHLADEYQRLVDLADQAGTPEDEQAFKDTLAGLAGEIDEKADRCAAVMATLQAEAEAIRNEELRLQARRQAIESNRARLGDYVLRCLQDAKIEKVKGPRFTLLVSKNPPKVVVDDDSLISMEFWVSEPVLNKSAIRDALKAGKQVAGAHLEQTTGLRIR